MAGNNTNIVHISAIEGLAIQIAENLDIVEPSNSKQFEAKDEMERHLASLQRNQIYNLRKAFE
jgi:hypothetical protein